MSFIIFREVLLERAEKSIEGLEPPYPALLPPRDTLKREIVGRAVKGQGRAISCTSEPPSLSDYVPKNQEGEGKGRLGEIDQDDRYNGGLLLGTILDDGPSRVSHFVRRSFLDPSSAEGGRR